MKELVGAVIVLINLYFKSIYILYFKMRFTLHYDTIHKINL